jgi:lysophospholipase L1-like esterase
MNRLLLKKVLLACLVPLVLLLSLELLLRLAGVEKQAAAPIVIQGEEGPEATVSPTDRKVLMDPDLLWAFVPGVTWDGLRINSEGFRTRPFEPQKPAGVMRVICLGDSCTAQGRPPYSDRLHALLQAEPPSEGEWEAFNMGVYGYSVMQGLRLFRDRGVAYQPDIVTIYFGWNDHWLYEKTDAARMTQRLSKVQAIFVRLAERFRITSALVGVGQKLAGEPAPGKTFRVPEASYQRALVDLITEIRAVGATPILITAPRRELTETLVKTGHAKDPDHAEIANDRYVAITRSVAVDLEVPVLDLVALFEGEAYDAYFMHDGIHFTDAGLDAIATRLHERIATVVRENGP